MKLRWFTSGPIFRSEKGQTLKKPFVLTRSNKKKPSHRLNEKFLFLKILLKILISDHHFLSIFFVFPVSLFVEKKY